MIPENAKPVAQAQSTGDDFDTRTKEYARAQKSKFYFKSSKRQLRDDEDLRASPKGHDNHHRSHHRKKRSKSSRSQDHPVLDAETHVPYMSSEQYLDPDTAFRESLFDAMADDEGAQFWEGVYGQPVPKVCPVKQGPSGKLEAMTDDEYAAHVRAEMYKKTHQYLFEEKQRRDRAKKEMEQLARSAHREGKAAEHFERRVDESFQRGKERKERIQRASQWAKRWTTYEEIWHDLGERKDSGIAKIPWPVFRGVRKDIGKEEVEKFYLNGPTSGEPDQADLMTTLKAERIRWHPDKMQQKLGGLGVDEAEMRAITAVFQIIDRLWKEVRGDKS